MRRVVVAYARLDSRRLQRAGARLARVLADVGIHLREASRVASRLAALGDTEVHLTVEPPVAIRSTQANRYYWGVVVAAISDHTGYEADEIHEILKHRFLPQPIWLRDAEGDIVEKLVIGQTTTTLTTAEFYEFVERIRRWAATDLHIPIPDPNEPLPADESGAAYPRRVVA